MHSTDFPILAKTVSGKKLIYFDSACTSLKPTATIDGISRYYTDYSCCSGDRGSTLLGSQLQEEIQITRKMVQKFIGARDSDCIVFTSSATDSVNILLAAIEKNIGTFIVSDIEHNSNFLPQYEISKKFNKEFIVVPYGKILDTNILDTILSGIKKPFLFSFTHTSNIIGGCFNIKEIADCVHRHNGFILIDDTQYVSYNDEDMTGNNIDFLVFSGHKIGGPTGIGILAIASQASLIINRSSRIGGGTIRSLGETPIYKGLPYYLEGGVQNFGGILGLQGILTWRSMRTTSLVNSHVLSLSNYFLNKIIEEKLENEFKIISIPESSLVSLIPLHFNVIDFHQYCNYFLSDEIISFRTGTMCVDMFTQTYLQSEINIMRFSFALYNTPDEIDILFNAINSYLGLLKK